MLVAVIVIKMTVKILMSVVRSLPEQILSFKILEVRFAYEILAYGTENAAIGSFMLRHIFFKIVVEDYEIVILLHVMPEFVMFRHKTLEFIRRTIIGQFSRFYHLMGQHGFEKLLSYAAPLYCIMNIKVQDGKRRNFFHVARSGRDKKPFYANF